MKCYIINLDRSPERMSRMEHLLSSHSIEYERIQAVDGLSFTTDQMFDYYKQHKQGKGMTPGEVACAESHLLAIRKVASGADDYAIIMEDDLHLSDDAGVFINSCEWIPNGVDLIKLETVNEPTIINSDEFKLLNGRRLIALVHKHWGAGAYIISKKAAQKVVKDYVAGAMPVDDYLFDPTINTFNLWQIQPSIAVQDIILKDDAKPEKSFLASTLEMERHEIYRTGESRKIGLAARIKREIVRFFRKMARRISLFWGLNISRKFVKTTIKFRR